MLLGPEEKTIVDMSDAYFLCMAKQHPGTGTFEELWNGYWKKTELLRSYGGTTTYKPGELGIRLRVHDMIKKQIGQSRYCLSDIKRHGLMAVVTYYELLEDD